MKVLIFGANGMIGSAMMRVLSEKRDWQVFGTVRADAHKRFFSGGLASRLIAGGDLEKHDALVGAMSLVRPDVVVNCVGLTKHHKESTAPLLTIPVNSLLPHRIADICSVAGARLVHISTDCVFSGSKGRYTEDDPGDATDLYGRSKLLGEVDYAHAVTLRTSTIGHEFETAYGLLEWFLRQEKSCKGYSRAIFSGLPSTVLAQIVRDIVIPRSDLRGLYHIGANPINKYDLLCLIAKVYGISIHIDKDDEFIIDRSLNSERFQRVTDYVAPTWPALIESMYSTHIT